MTEPSLFSGIGKWDILGFSKMPRPKGSKNRVKPLWPGEYPELTAMRHVVEIVSSKYDKKTEEIMARRLYRSDRRGFYEKLETLKARDAEDMAAWEAAGRPEKWPPPTPAPDSSSSPGLLKRADDSTLDDGSLKASKAIYKLLALLTTEEKK